MQKDIQDRSIAKGRGHSVHLHGRERLVMTGVIDVESFDEMAIYLSTDAGLATVTGKELHINRLNIDDGQLIIEGLIVSLAYQDKSPKEKGSFFGRLFS